MGHIAHWICGVRWETVCKLYRLYSSYEYIILYVVRNKCSQRETGGGELAQCIGAACGK